MMRRPPRSTLFPYRRSSDLATHRVRPAKPHTPNHHRTLEAVRTSSAQEKPARPGAPAFSDRKSTRLNSSHANISYAVFCLKKKKKKKTMKNNMKKLMTGCYK